MLRTVFNILTAEEQDKFNKLMARARIRTAIREYGGNLKAKLRAQSISQFFKGEDPALRMSTAEAQIEHLLFALSSGNVEDPIFTAEDLPLLVTTAFAQGRLAESTVTTLLRYAQTRKDYSEESYSVKLSIASADHLVFNYFFYGNLVTLINLPGKKWLPRLTEEQTRIYFKMIKSLAFSSRLFFYVESSTARPMKPQRLETFLDVYLRAQGTPTRIEKQSIRFDIYLGTILFELYNQIRFGWTVRMRPTPHLLTPLDIKTYRLNNARPINVVVPGMPLFIKAHAQVNDATMLSNHDLVHCDLLATMPRKIFLAFNYLIKLISQQTGFPMSKEIWQWTDFANSIAFEKRDLDLTSLFIHLLISKNDEGSDWYHFLNLDFTSEWLHEPTLCGWILLFDWRQRQDYWNDKFGIEINKFPKNFDDNFAIIDLIQNSAIYSDQDIHQKIFIARILFYFPENYWASLLNVLMLKKDQIKVTVYKKQEEPEKNLLDITVENFILEDLNIRDQLEEKDLLINFLNEFMKIFNEKNELDFLQNHLDFFVKDIRSIVYIINSTHHFTFFEFQVALIKHIEDNLSTLISSEDDKEILIHTFEVFCQSNSIFASIYDHLPSMIEPLVERLNKLEFLPRLKM